MVLVQQSFRRRCNPLVLALAGVWLAGTAAAAEDDENLYFSDLPIVASVSRLPQRLSEVPASVTVIDRDMIRASGARNFADLLRLVPGFQVTPPNQESAVVAYHGLSNEEYTPRVQVLIDGRSQYSPLFNSGVNWNLLPVVLENIERIEVIRGSNTVSYGSNAFLGVVNIITQDTSQTQGWMIAANHGNASIRDETVRWGGRSGPVDVRMTYHQLGDSGFRKMFDANRWFDPHDSRHSKVFDLRVDAPLGDRDELQFTLSHASDISQYGRPNSLTDPFRDLSQSSTALSGQWRRVLGEGSEVKIRYSHVEDWASGAYQERLSYADKNSVTQTYYYPANPGGESRIDEIDFEHLFSPSAKTRFVWGMSGKWTALSSYQQFSTKDWQQRSSHRIFGNLEWRPDKEWLFNLGGSFENDSVVGELFDPRASVSYHLFQDHTLRFVASRAHRTPSLYEAYGNTSKAAAGTVSPVDRTFYAKPGLKAERIDTLELGYLGQYKPWRASFDFRAFHERSPNRITIIPYAPPATAADDKFEDSAHPYGRADSALNLERVTIQGYEYQANWQALERTRLLYSYAYIRTYAFLSSEDMVVDAANNIAKISRQTSESAPRRSQSLMVIQKLPFDLEASLMYYKSGWMRWRRNSYTSPYERVDWRLAWPFKLGSSRAEVAYTAQMANHSIEGRRETRVANEMHWLSLRLDF
ncbi:TonB-dependent receptor plug domain-containing protein [Dechloromonas denitrificans]|uniref:TonB-dependent receptor plug domain-containing protein n=1 Tax=Dechloromonas denitrificans TaxID=281362 RepID=UPI001CF8B8CF|nr:TonB-dependent receptor [Dechloromonas denitrificans]UCV03812.1 TonB-dependent receptor [Dechloromonas denitrificans]UCV08075.1 TonB-dependent receptor [Dechloromonas denitrificans]